MPGVWKERIERNCLACGKVMYLRPCEVKENRRYCDKACWYGWDKSGHTIERNCLTCGEVMHLAPWEVKYNKRHCGFSCLSKKIEVRCLSCDRVMSLRPSEKNKKFCNKECYSKSQIGVSPSAENRSKRSLSMAMTVAKKPRYSKMELSLGVILEPRGYKHTSQEPLWVRGVGRSRVPDWFNVPDKKIVEFFGCWWHRMDRGHEQEIIDWYKDAGWHCEIIWEDELEEFLSTGGV